MAGGVGTQDVIKLNTIDVNINMSVRDPLEENQLQNEEGTKVAHKRRQYNDESARFTRGKQTQRTKRARTWYAIDCKTKCAVHKRDANTKDEKGTKVARDRRQDNRAQSTRGKQSCRP